MENAIVVNNLTKKYDGFVLNNISFQVPTGSVVGFIGENGAGKSTTIRAMLGIVIADTGEAWLLGHKVGRKTGDEAWREQIGVVFDECNFHWELRVKQVQNIMRDIYKTWNDEKFLGYMKRFEIPLDKKVKELSRGMKMKLSIAVALSHDSRVLILDEATSNVDTHTEVLIQRAMARLMKGRTSFVIAHRLSTIRDADVILVMRDGDIVEQGSHDELMGKGGFYAELYNSQFEGQGAVETA